MTDTRIRRKKYIIAGRFQLRYVLYILVFLYLGAAIAGYTVYYSTWTTLGESLANVYPQGRLVYILKQANAALLLRLFLISPLFILIGIILSHRIAGPVYRMGKYMESLMLGDYSRGLTLRKNDEFKPLAYKMTHLCYKLREDEETRKKMGGEILHILRQRGTAPEVLSKVKMILEDMDSAHVHERDPF